MNSSCVVAIHSMRDGPSSPSRARNASSADGVAKRFQGQASWEMRRHSRFSIPLSTGRRALRPKLED
jgi:hypothetical protein